ncbi:hypothetical protein EMF73_34460, partial [Klebsiella pneumoniae]
MATVNAEAQGSGSSQGRAAPSVRLSLGDSYDSYLASLNPSAWWKLADAVGSGTVADSSGNGHTGTVTGGVTFGQTGPIVGGKAAAFDGSTGYIATAYQPTFETITIAVWANAVADLGPFTFVMAAGGAGSSGFTFYTQNMSGINIEQGGTGYVPPWQQNPGTGWEFWVLTWDG